MYNNDRNEIKTRKYKKSVDSVDSCSFGTIEREKKKELQTSASMVLSDSDLRSSSSSSSSFTSSKCSMAVCGISCNSSLDLNSNRKMYGGKSRPKITYSCPEKEKIETM